MAELNENVQVTHVTKLHSEIRRHGLREKAQSQKVSNRSALANRATKMLGTHKSNEVQQKSSDQKKRDRAYEPKAYGKHEGSIHSKILLQGTGSLEEVTEAINGAINSMVLTFQNMPSMDLQSRKIAYSDALTKVMNQVQSDGSVLIDNTEAVDAVRKSNSFTYVRSQIVVMIYADEQFEGSTLSDRGDYEMVLLSKVVMTEELLDLKSLGDLDEVRKDPKMALKRNISTGSRPGLVVDRPHGKKGMRRASDFEIQNLRQSQLE